MSCNYEVADIINRFYNEDFRIRIPVHQQRTLYAIQRCRTASLGGHVDSCDSCGHIKISYNSCRNRNCPKCQGLQKEMWAIQREEELLPIAYFHLVFTLPSELNGLALRNPRFIYDLLFEAAWYTIRTFGEDPKCLGARSAATIVLHTWGQHANKCPCCHKGTMIIRDIFAPNKDPPSLPCNHKILISSNYKIDLAFCRTPIPMS